MLNRKSKLLLVFMLVLSLALVAGCGNDDNGDDALTIAVIDVDNQIEDSYDVLKGTPYDKVGLPEIIKVELSNGSVEEVELSWDLDSYEKEQPGTYDISASFSITGIDENLTGNISTQIVVEGLTADVSDFRITSLKVEPETVVAGLEGIEVTAEVQNYGDQEDEQDIVIKFLDEDGELMTYDGEMKETIATISLDSGYSKTIEFVESEFPEIDPGDYTIKVKSDDDSATVDLEVVSQDEVDVEDAKIFASNLKNHGVDLYNLGQREADNVQKHFEDDVIPYAKAIGSRLFNVQKVMDTIFVLGEPSAYKVNLDYLDQYYDLYNSWVGSHFDDYWDYQEDYDENSDNYDSYKEFYFAERNDDYDSWRDYVNSEVEEFIVEKEEIEDLSKLKWELTFEGNNEKVVVEVTNPEDVIIKDEIVREHEDYDYYFSDTFKADFTTAEFSYKHTDEDDNDFDWSLEFNLDTDVEETIEYYNEWEDEGENWEGNIITEKEIIDLEFIVPRKATVNLKGTMIDSWEVKNEEGDSLPDIGTIELDTSLDFDVENEQHIVYEGSFYSEEINYEGRTEINFGEIANYQEAFDGIVDEDLGYLPSINSIESTGKWWTDKLSIDGSFTADFIQKDVKIYGETVEFSVPNLIEFSGEYESEFEDDEENAVEFKLTGGIAIDPDYSEFDMTADDLDNENNYLSGEVRLDGSLNSNSLKGQGFDEVSLDITVTREDYDRVSTDFRYDFDGHRYIQGDAVFTPDVDPEINLVNEQDLRITIADLGYEYTIGDIRGADGTLYAYIRYDEEPYIDFADGTSESLVPELK